MNRRTSQSLTGFITTASIDARMKEVRNGEATSNMKGSSASKCDGEKDQRSSLRHPGTPCAEVSNVPTCSSNSRSICGECWQSALPVLAPSYICGHEQGTLAISQPLHLHPSQ